MFFLALLGLLVLGADAITYKSCGGEYTANTGVINSPGYPGTYGVYYNCTYTITQTFNGIYLRFYDLCTTKNDHFVSVYDGSVSGKLLFRGSGCDGTANWEDQVFKASSNKMVITFFSSNTNFRRGFMARYNTNNIFCNAGGYFATTGTVITTPSFPQNYQNDLFCDYYYYASNCGRPSIIFQSFDTEEDHDYVTVYNGNADTSPVLARISGTELAIKTFTSSGAYMVVRFTSDFSWVRPGFNATIKC